MESISKMYKIGDKVSVLDDAIDGIIVSINGSSIEIETTDGFNMKFEASDLIKIENTNDLHVNFNKSNILREKEILKTNHISISKTKKELPVPDFDLHIEKLVKNYKSMNNFDILTIQLDTAKRHIDFALKNRIPKIVLIHGIGDGILKAELDHLIARYENISFQDANYQKYGNGATEIYFKQNKTR